MHIYSKMKRTHLMFLLQHYDRDECDDTICIYTTRIIARLSSEQSFIVQPTPTHPAVYRPIAQFTDSVNVSTLAGIRVMKKQASA